MEGKTRIIVTHALHFLKYADKIFYVENGRIKFKGNYNMIKKEQFFEQYMEQLENEKEKQDEKQKAAEPVKKAIVVEDKQPVNELRKPEPVKVQENALLRMFAVETKESGSLGLRIVHIFIKNTGGYLCFFLYVFLAVLGAFGKIYGVYYIFSWASEFDEFEDEKWKRMGIFSCILYGYCLLAIIRCQLYMKLGVGLSRRMHANMIFRVLHAPVEEFIEVVSLLRSVNC